VSAERPVPRVLYLSRDGVLDGLGDSQILGYLRSLADAHRFWLLTFEKSMADAEPLRAQLAARGITWRAIPFEGSGSPVRAGWGLLRFTLVALRLAVVHRIRIVHARSYVPCAIALVVRWLCLGRPRVIFDMRGFWVDERAEARGWRRDRRIYRAGKWLERRLLRGAGEIVTLNHGARAEVARLGGTAPVTVIPTCVDVERFTRDTGAPPPVFAPWRDRLIFVYVGAAGFWQDPRTLAAFLAVAREEREDLAVVCLLRAGAEEMRRALAGAGLDTISHVGENVRAAELPRWLSAASVGLIWYRPAFSRLGNFPTKLGEYLACGLPVVIAGATADSVELVTRERVGVVVRGFSPESYRDAITEIVDLLKDPQTATRCCEVAERELAVRVGVARYAEIYRRAVRSA
jgi:glycosyltransferase involved in cell wall biosynthesis